jgi:hypothetical protein
MHIKLSIVHNTWYDNKHYHYFVYLLCYTFYHYFIIYSFYLLKKLSVKQPWAGPSRGILEEGTITTEDNSSLPVIAPENLPVGPDVKVEDSQWSWPCVDLH